MGSNKLDMEDEEQDWIDVELHRDPKSFVKLLIKKDKVVDLDSNIVYEQVRMMFDNGLL